MNWLNRFVNLLFISGLRRGYTVVGSRGLELVTDRRRFGVRQLPIEVVEYRLVKEARAMLREHTILWRIDPLPVNNEIHFSCCRDAMLFVLTFGGSLK